MIIVSLETKKIMWGKKTDSDVSDIFDKDTSKMKWQIIYAEEHGFVHVKTSGPINWADKKTLSKEAFDAGREKNVNAFLIDQKESPFRLSVLEIDQLPKMFRDIGFKPSDKVAILVNPDSIDKSVLRFIENVFSLSCLQIQIFADSDEANRWLKVKN
jgi:hypothetical protein